jgi:hypothetical protein
MKNGEKSKAVRIVDDSLSRIDALIRVHNNNISEDKPAIHGCISLVLISSVASATSGTSYPRLHALGQTSRREKKRKGHSDPAAID